MLHPRQPDFHHTNIHEKMGKGLFVSVICTLYFSGIRGEIITADLSHVQKSGLVKFPIYPDLNFTIAQRGPYAPHPEIWLEYNMISTVEHYGTHVDVPSHMYEGAWRMHEVPVEYFMGPAVVIDITERAKTNRDAEVMKEDLIAWEEKYGRIPDGAIVLMYSNWDKKYSSNDDYLGSTNSSDTSTLHYPGFHPGSIQWLVDNRPNFHGIGVDTISLDSGVSTEFWTHRYLFKANKIGYENLANLEKIPESGAMFYAAPMNLHDGSGCPVRAFAIYDTNTSGSVKVVPSILLVLLTLLAIYKCQL